MLRNKVPKCIALALAVLLLFPASMSGQTARAEVDPPKTTPALREAMKQYDGPYPVYIFGEMPDLDYRYGDQEYFDAYAGEFMKEVGLQENQLLFGTVYTHWLAVMYMRIAQKCRSVPLAVAWLTKEDIGSALCLLLPAWCIGRISHHLCQYSRQKVPVSHPFATLRPTRSEYHSARCAWIFSSCILLSFGIPA